MEGGGLSSEGGGIVLDASYTEPHQLIDYSATDWF